MRTSRSCALFNYQLSFELAQERSLLDFFSFLLCLTLAFYKGGLREPIGSCENIRFLHHDSQAFIDSYDPRPILPQQVGRSVKMLKIWSLVRQPRLVICADAHSCLETGAAEGCKRGRWHPEEKEGHSRTASRAKGSVRPLSQYYGA